MKNTDKTPSQTEQTASDPRRELLRGGIATLAALALGGAVAACSDDDKDPAGSDAGSSGGKDAGTGSTEDGGSATDAGSPTTDADVAPLNALLGAEYGAIAAYQAGAGLIEAAPASDALASLKDVIIALATDILSQHTAHAAALVSTIEELGGTPVEKDSVTFTPPKALTDKPTILNVLKFAAGAERGAAVAYNQTLATLEAASTRYLAGAIEGDETQHFIVLTALVAGLVQPGANLSVDTADDVFPSPFVSKVGAADGLESIPDYFA
jgi:bacterioferritin (cytochrome b1)